MFAGFLHLKFYLFIFSLLRMKWNFLFLLDISNTRSESRSLLSPRRRFSHKSLRESAVVGDI